MFGSAAQKSKWLPLLSDKLLGAFALTEPGSGSDSAALSTRAVRTETAYVLNGSKTFVTNGQHADLFVLLARTSQESKHRGITAFLVERGSGARDRRRSKMGIRGSDTTDSPSRTASCRENRLWDGARVSRRHADPGRRPDRRGRAGGRDPQARSTPGPLRARARQFGRRPGVQAIQWMLADMKAAIEACGFSRCAPRGSRIRAAARSRAAIAKLIASKTARECADRAVQIHGGYGYTKEFAVERYYRDAKVTELYEGTSEIQRIVIANSLFRKSTTPTTS
jgi:alkylation response protein AidB-like acyl-CoA dehydrogenase